MGSKEEMVRGMMKMMKKKDKATLNLSRTIVED